MARRSPGQAQAQAADARYVLKREFAACTLERPITLVIPPDGTNRMFLVQQTGKIVILPADRRSPKPKRFST